MIINRLTSATIKPVIVAIPAHTPAIVPIKATNSEGVNVITVSMSHRLMSEFLTVQKR